MLTWWDVGAVIGVIVPASSDRVIQPASTFGL